jgi:AcrR family transcriptional regulator
MPATKNQDKTDTGSKAMRRDRKSGDEEGTRERILRAATRVFAQHSFRAASTRMIAAEAGVDHPLIHYYFGSKEKLFEEVTAKVYRETMEIMAPWFEEMAGRSPTESLTLFVDRLLDYYFDHPEAQQIIFVNMVQLGQLDQIPGYRYIFMHVERLRQMLEEMAPLPGAKRDVRIFVYCFHALVDSLLGAKPAHAQLLGMDPDGDEYRSWIRDSLLAVFTPMLREFFSGAKKPGRDRKSTTSPTRP